MGHVIHLDVVRHCLNILGAKIVWVIFNARYRKMLSTQQAQAQQASFARMSLSAATYVYVCVCVSLLGVCVRAHLISQFSSGYPT